MSRRAVARPRGAGPVPRVGQPRAPDAADLDPRLRRGARGAGDPAGGVGAGDRRRGRPPRAARRRPARARPVRPLRTSPSRASRSIWPASCEQSVERHLPRAREIGVELSGRSTAGRLGASAIPGGSSRRVSNLIENALRLTPAGGSVTVQRRRRARSPYATPVPGSAPTDIPRAFERFYLYGRYRSERPVGSGPRPRDRRGADRRAMGGYGGGRRPARATASAGREFTIRLPVYAAGAARSARCCPTFRLTRWSALSTVLQSQPILRPTSS